MTPTPDYEFTTDGCSSQFMRDVHRYWRWRGKTKLSDDVTTVCELHDKAYWQGGPAKLRIKADAALLTELVDVGVYPWFARLMLIGVSIGGQWWLPFGFRWGYGHKYPGHGV